VLTTAREEAASEEPVSGYALMILAQVLRFAGKEDEAITDIN
jgi:hypothetical protein